MFYVDKRLQYPVKVENPDPVYARMLQQAIGGVEGEIRVCMQYFFQGWGARGPTTKYRDMLLTPPRRRWAISRCSPRRWRSTSRRRRPPFRGGRGRRRRRAVMGGGNARHTSRACCTGISSPPAWRPSRQLRGRTLRHEPHLRQRQPRADMYCNVGRERRPGLAVRLYNAAHDAGMKDMLHFMIARDTMHQQQWLAVIEEMGGHEGNLPIPNSFPQELEDGENAYNFTSARWTARPRGRALDVRPALDGKGTFSWSRIVPWARNRSSAGPARQRRADAADRLNRIPRSVLPDGITHDRERRGKDGAAGGQRGKVEGRVVGERVLLTRNEAAKRPLVQRLNRIEGQVRGPPGDDRGGSLLPRRGAADQRHHRRPAGGGPGDHRPARRRRRADRRGFRRPEEAAWRT